MKTREIVCTAASIASLLLALYSVMEVRRCYDHLPLVKGRISSNADFSPRSSNQGGIADKNGIHSLIEPSPVAHIKSEAIKNSDAEQRKANKIAGMRNRYAAFVRKHGLTAEETERFLDLLYEQSEFSKDLGDLKQQFGFDSAAEAALRKRFEKPISDGLRHLLGGEGMADYANYEILSFYRNAYVDPLNELLQSFSMPLSDEQSDQLTALIGASDHPTDTDSGDKRVESKVDWKPVIEGSTKLLSPQQLAVLTRFVEEKRL
jgi:hypothetical protein